MSNPHYKPELQVNLEPEEKMLNALLISKAQTTLINFTVTRTGLEDQLLADVVRAERPDLEELKAELTVQVWLIFPKR